MTRLAMLRHGPTAWTAEQRIQGHSDVPLSPAGRAEVGGWRLPPEVQSYRVLVSPLSRARETAELLGLADATVEPALAERCWGDWEGMRLPELRDRYGTDMVAWEALGLDFRPPNGESPRDLQQRLEPLLARIAAARRDTLAVCHRGVLRAVYAPATGWDMRTDPPDKLRDGCLQSFELDAEGRPEVVQLNRRLA